MIDRLKEILDDRILPYVDLGLYTYSKVLGSLRRNLQLAGFGTKESYEIVLSLIDFPKRKRS